MNSNDIENIFYKRLTQLRIQKGVSARDMSLSLGQNENYINLIENKHNYPSMTGFFYICEYFGISPADFFNDKNENPYKTNELLSIVELLNEDEVEHITSVMKDIVKRSKEDK